MSTRKTHSTKGIAWYKITAHKVAAPVIPNNFVILLLCISDSALYVFFTGYLKVPHIPWFLHNSYIIIMRIEVVIRPVFKHFNNNE